VPAVSTVSPESAEPAVSATKPAPISAMHDDEIAWVPRRRRA
jgi:hypothetical protein